MSNVTLIGMPGCGKSTIGVLLAKALGKAFVDTDIVFQAEEGMSLQKILLDQGLEAFLKKEEAVVLRLQDENAVIATGGSVIYGRHAMEKLHESGIVLCIRLSYDEIARRLYDYSQRGVVLRKGQTLRMLYDQRMPLYEREADRILDADGLSMEQCVEALVRMSTGGA